MATLPLDIEMVAGSVAIGVDSRGDHHLLIPIADNTEVVEDTRSAHVQVNVTRIVLDGSVRRFIDIVCHRQDLFDSFDDLLASILDNLAGEISGPVAVTRAFDEWRELLRHRAGLLGETAMRGLFGELVVLEILARHGLAGPLARLWTGPDHAAHDFRCGTYDLEVKTLGSAGSEVVIHGLEQLSPPTGGELRLVVVRLESSAEGRSLPEQVAVLEGMVADRRGFGLQLAKSGFAAADAQYYGDRRFAVISISVLMVDEAFPQLTASSLAAALPPEIFDVRYTIDIGDYLLSAPTGSAAEQLIHGGLQE